MEHKHAVHDATHGTALHSDFEIYCTHHYTHLPLQRKDIIFKAKENYIWE